jgi:hypothetical protein
MSDRYNKCLPVALSRSLKDETMFHPWMKVSFTFIQGWKYLLLSYKDESIFYFHPRMKVANFSPKNSAPIGKVGEAAGVMDVIFI